MTSYVGLSWLLVGFPAHVNIVLSRICSIHPFHHIDCRYPLDRLHGFFGECMMPIGCILVFLLLLFWLHAVECVMCFEHSLCVTLFVLQVQNTNLLNSKVHGLILQNLYLCSVIRRNICTNKLLIIYFT